MLSGRAVDPNFLRFGRSTGQNYLKSGWREPSFLRPGRNNFLRFGRNTEEFNRDDRKPNFLRFGK